MMAKAVEKPTVAGNETFRAMVSPSPRTPDSHTAGRRYGESIRADSTPVRAEGEIVGTKCIDGPENDRHSPEILDQHVQDVLRADPSGKEEARSSAHKKTTVARAKTQALPPPL